MRPERRPVELLSYLRRRAAGGLPGCGQRGQGWRHLGVADRTVSKWEAAGQTTFPRPDTQAVLDTVLARADDAAQERFAVLCRESASTPAQRDDDNSPADPLLGETDDVKRRQLLRLLSLSSATLALPPDPGDLELDRMLADADPRDRIDAATLADFGRLHVHMWHVYGLARVKQSVLPMVHEQLDVLTRATTHAGERFREPLCALLSDMYQLAGEVHVDSGRVTDAAQCYAVGATAAREAGSHDLWATALTRQVFVAIDDGDRHDAVRLLDHAESLARRGDRYLTTAHWAAAVRAQAYAEAELGDDQRCRRDLDLAGSVLDLPPMPTSLGWLRFDGARIPEQRGTCLVAVGRFDEAESVLEEALLR